MPIPLKSSTAMMRGMLCILVACVLAAFSCSSERGESSAEGAAPALSALIVDGQNNHDWRATTPVLRAILEDSGLFTVDVATAPPRNSDMSGFRPEFGAYDVVVMNYNGDPWPESTRRALETYMQRGGGMVAYHAADNAFPAWEEYNRMIALGGWEGRNEQWGPYVRYRNGKFVRDHSPGPGGHHGSPHAFQIVVRDADHPVTRGLPVKWMHPTDELYDSLRGPAENLTVLATAWSDPETGGTGEHEPVLMTVDYGEGRVFHTVLGHDPAAMYGVGFIVTLIRGTEWAATGRVTYTAIPGDFPGPDTVSMRKVN